MRNRYNFLNGRQEESKMYKELKFSTFGKAKVVQKQMKKEYGYKPEIFKVTSPSKERFFTIVKPKGLKKL